MSADLNALRARGWHLKAPTCPQPFRMYANREGLPIVEVHHPDRATAEAMLLASCAAADGEPTERERALEEALRYYANPLNYSEEGAPGISREDSPINGEAVEWDPDFGARARAALEWKEGQ